MPIKFFYILLLSLFLWLFVSNSHATGALPYEYNQTELLDNGKYFLNHNDNTGNVRSFFFKPNFYSSTEILYTWIGVTRKNAKGIAFQHGYILNAMPFGDNLFAVWRSSNGIDCGIIDSTAEVMIQESIPGDFPNSNIDVKIKFKKKGNAFLILINNDLYSCFLEKNKINVKNIASNVYSFDIINHDEFRFLFYYAQRRKRFDLYSEYTRRAAFCVPYPSFRKCHA